MSAIERRRYPQVRVRGLLALTVVVVAVLMLAGLVGYWARGATSTSPPAAAAPAAAHSAAGTSRGLNADSASGYGAGSVSAPFSVARGLNADSTSGYAGTGALR